MLQLIPVPVGSVSVNTAEVAVPAPLFDTASVNPIAEPAVAVALSAVFVNAKFGHCTAIDAVACTLLVLLALAVAVLERLPQLPLLVLLVTCTVAATPCARFPKLQLSD